MAPASSGSRPRSRLRHRPVDLAAHVPLVPLQISVALRGLEGSVESGVEDLNGGVRGGGHARDGEDAGGGEEARKLVGEDGDPDASAAGDEAPCVGERGGEAFADLGGNGVVEGGAQILDVYAEGAQVGDEHVLEGAVEGVCSSYDFVGAGRGHGGGVGLCQAKLALLKQS
ncbi:hypothetical protein FH972_013133 [Carpinus fangiana]|uniref:Uncharacterized protein n=1 Tax=Carpinus fangiana TaxID=176857 RepID=A0A5N6R912_9ROSI|nr:hypothetical protein FH972_013133 [Carpinus fangiana]